MIKDFAANQQIDELLFVKNITNGVTTSGNPYLNVVFQDKTGQIDGKVWEVTSAIQQNLKVGIVVRVIGLVNQYKSNLQLKVNNVELVSEYNIADFLITSEFSENELQASLKSFVDEINDQDIQFIIKEILNRHWDDIKQYPAASSIHHAYVRGLLEHTVSMLNLAKQCVINYPKLNKSLLYGAIILHDIGKIKELSGAGSTEYTLEGKLLGHITIITLMIDQIANAHHLNSESLLLLKHTILAHHGKKEYGSPVDGQIPEAIIIHYIDDMDAKMNIAFNALDKIEEGEFSESLFALDRRTLYKAKSQQ